MEAAIFTSKRAGRVEKQLSGYYAFLPSPLPPNPPLLFDNELIQVLSEADRTIGQLNGLASMITDPDLFVYLYVRKEALLSSQIEGTQCSLEDILQESRPKVHNQSDIEEVSNYVFALNHGLEKLKDLPVSTRLIKEIHKLLMKNGRGSEKTPGEFRKSQNWIGPPGSTLTNALYVPPPEHEISNLMSNMEIYIHEDHSFPPLIRAALVHSQFETIHPFLDGNGRLGRLLITFLLCSWGVLGRPLLYLSYFFKANRTEYYSRLMRTRTNGDYEGWIRFFLRGVVESGQMANRTAIEIHDLHQNDLRKLQEEDAPVSVIQVYNSFCKFPIASVPELERKMNSNQNTLNRAIQSLIRMGIIKQVSEKKRNRTFAYEKYLNLLTRDTRSRPDS